MTKKGVDGLSLKMKGSVVGEAFSTDFVVEKEPNSVIQMAFENSGIVSTIPQEFRDALAGALKVNAREMILAYIDQIPEQLKSV